MNWLNTIIISIGAAFSSLFGISHPALTSTTTVSVPVQQVVETSQVSNQQTPSSSGTSNNTTALPSAQQSNTSSLQIYSYNDSQNDFSVQYPSGWIVTDVKPKTMTGDHTILFKSPASTQTKPILLSIETWLAESNRNATAQIAQFSNPTYGSGLEKSGVNIGTISATEFTMAADSSVSGPSVSGSFIIFDNGAYTYTVSSTNVDRTTFQNFYDSLKFNGVTPPSVSVIQQGEDARITADLQSLRAELISDTSNGTYTDIKNASSVSSQAIITSGSSDWNSTVSDIKTHGGNLAVFAGGTPNGLASVSAGYSIYAQLNSENSAGKWQYICVDSSGNFKNNGTGVIPATVANVGVCQ